MERKTKQTNLIKKTALALVLAALVSMAVLGAAGDAKDPLLTLSKLRTVYLDQVRENARQKAEGLSDAARQYLDQQAGQVWLQPLVDAVVQKLSAQGAGSAGQVVQLSRGDVISGPLGAGFIVRQGTAEIIGTELVNITAGGSRQAGRAIANNIYYLIPQEDGSGVRITSETAKAQLTDGARVIAANSAYQPRYTKYAQALHVMDLFRGTDIGYELERQPTRLETLIILIRLLGEEPQALAYQGSHPFTDVTGWPDANKYIAYAVEKGYTNGISATEFAPNAPANAATLYTYVLRALGYSDREGDFAWNSTDRLKAVEIGLLTQQQMETIQQGEFYRDQAAFISWQSLNVPLKGTDTLLRDKLVEAGVITQDQYDQASGMLG